MINKKRVGSGIGIVLGATVLFTYLLMVMGTFVTSTGSGLACPDWPLCYGTVVPPLELSIWFEWSHRLLGGITSALILVSTLIVWRYYKGLPRVFTSLMISLLAVGVLLGGITVLVEAPMLSTFTHIAIISSHLIIATLVLICLLFTLRYVLLSRDKGTDAAGDTKGFTCSTPPFARTSLPASASLRCSSPPPSVSSMRRPTTRSKKMTSSRAFPWVTRSGLHRYRFAPHSRP